MSIDKIKQDYESLMEVDKYNKLIIENLQQQIELMHTMYRVERDKHSKLQQRALEMDNNNYVSEFNKMAQQARETKIATDIDRVVEENGVLVAKLIDRDLTVQRLEEEIRRMTVYKVENDKRRTGEDKYA